MGVGGGADETQTFRNPKPDLVALLEQSGSDANGVRGKGDAGKKKARRDKAVSFLALASGA